MPDKVIIVGGGLAGLAAASALADNDVSVTLLESRPRLGGRASSFTDRDTETCIDNCQHVSLGCCTNFNHFCRCLGIDRFFRRESELYFLGPEVRGLGRDDIDGKVDRLVSSWLPAPFHLIKSFQRLSYLERRDRRLLAKGLRALALADPETSAEQRFDRWLHEHKQTRAAAERFWNVVLVSALSESLERISVAHARKVFVDAFMSNKRGWEVRIPTVPLDNLYGTQVTDWLTERGVAIRLQCGVRQIVLENDSCIAVELRSGERLQANHFIVAVPHHLVLGLLPERMRSHPKLIGIERLETAPIASVHFWFDRPITSLPHAVFVGRLSQWMFNRSVLQSRASGLEADSDQGTADGPRTYYLQVVISAARNLPGRSQEQTISAVVRELAEIWPETANARLVHSRLVTEHKAVFSAKPGADAFRPYQQSPIPNLQLAGDWTQTGWPATMESAVRSGYLAAENVLRHLGREVQLLQPDLPPSLLSRLLLGL